jgi:hypothetical protein
MGRASRAKKNRGPKRSRTDLLDMLAENREFLQRSAYAFDHGYEAEAKRMAVVLRVLLHDTDLSHSLLKQLNVKTQMNFLDTAAPINPANLLPTPGLVMMKMTRTSVGADGQYVAPLGMERPHPPRLRTFAEWWRHPVMKVDGTWSRKELVLTLANTEGGAHVDPDLNGRYESLAKANGIGWTASAGANSQPFAGNVVAVAVRQVAYEVVTTLDREQRLFL